MAEIKVDLTNEDKVKSVVSFIMLKQLLQPISKHDAYKLDIVDSKGKLKREPETEEEKKSYTLFDKLIFKIKTLLGSRLSQLNRFVWLQTVLDDDFFKNMVVTGGLEKRAAVTRVKQDIERLLEKHDLGYDEFYNMLIAEEMENHKKRNKGEGNASEYS